MHRCQTQDHISKHTNYSESIWGVTGRYETIVEEIGIFGQQHRWREVAIYDTILNAIRIYAPATLIS